MGIESILVFLIVGAIAGWLAGLIVKGFGFGLIGNMVVGIIGAFIAGFLFPPSASALERACFPRSCTRRSARSSSWC